MMETAAGDGKPATIHPIHLKEALEMITRNEFDELKDLLEIDAAVVTMGDDDNLTLLHLAVDLNRLDMIQLLLDSGADVNVKTLEARLSPLHIAVRNGSLRAIDLLLSKGADVNSRNLIDHTPLHIAVTTNNLEVVRVLLFWKADPNVVTGDRRKETPLLKAATISYAMTRLLLDSGAQVSRYGEEIHVAILANKPDIASLIIDHMERNRKILILRPNRIGRTHLQSLCSHVINCDPIVALNLAKKLVFLGEDVNRINLYGSVFHILVVRGEDPISSLLLDYFLSIDGRNPDVRIPFVGSSFGGTPLYLAIKMGMVSFAIKLIKEGFANASSIRVEAIKWTSETLLLLHLLHWEGCRLDPFFLEHNPPTTANPRIISSFSDFLSFLRERQSTVRPLKEMVRIFLRRRHLEKLPMILTQLKVPTLLQDYLLYRNVAVLS